MKYFVDDLPFACVRSIVVIVVSTAASADTIAVEVVHGCAIGVDLAAHRDRNEELVSHDLVVGVLRQVNGEEAGVGLWEACLIHVGRDADVMPLAHVLKVDWKAGAAPNELEIHLSLIVIEGSHHAPEALDDGR